MEIDLDFNGDELILLYVLAHDHAAECTEMLSGDIPPDLPRGYVQDRLKAANGLARKLRKILTGLGIDVDSLT